MTGENRKSETTGPVRLSSFSFDYMIDIPSFGYMIDIRLGCRRFPCHTAEISRKTGVLFPVSSLITTRLCISLPPKLGRAWQCAEGMATRIYTQQSDTPTKPGVTMRVMQRGPEPGGWRLCAISAAAFAR